MTGARSPAAAATLVNLAWNGSPEGLPRGTGATPREAIPPSRCAFAAAARAGNVRIWRRVIRRVTTPWGDVTETAAEGRAHRWALPSRTCELVPRGSAPTDR